MTEQTAMQQSLILVEQGREIMNDLGLADILRTYGEFAIVGSFDLGLLYKPDIDFIVKVTEFDPYRYFSICAQIAEVIKPIRMKYIDQRVAQFPLDALPSSSGYFLGISQRHRGIEWSLDGWCFLADVYEERLAYHNNFKRRIAEQHAGETIVNLKAALYGRKNFRSNDLYWAVLDGNVKTVSDFEVWYRKKYTEELGPAL